jgi:hypothetical protein
MSAGIASIVQCDRAQFHKALQRNAKTAHTASANTIMEHAAIMAASPDGYNAPREWQAM